MSALTNIAIAVLAAGSSSRMGQRKLLLPLAGLPLAAWSVRAACASEARDVIVIVGADAAELQEGLMPGRQRLIANPDFAEGQGSSLRVAVASVAPQDSGLVILLADQPFMDQESVDRIIEVARQEPARIIMGATHGRTGHPVYLPRRVFAEARMVTADEGARTIIGRERDRVRTVPLSNELAQFDVDTPEDYQRALDNAYVLDG